MTKYLLLILFFFIIIILLGFLIIILLPDDKKIIYIIRNTICFLPLSQEAQNKLAKIIIEILLYFRNLKPNYFFSRIHIPSSSQSIKKEIKIPKEFNLWDEKINYCSKKDGKIDDIYYDESVLPSKATVTLY